MRSKRNILLEVLECRRTIARLISASGHLRTSCLGGVTLARLETDVRTALARQPDLGVLSRPLAKNILVFFWCKSAAQYTHPVPARGACRPSRNVGRGERWACDVTRRVTSCARRNRVVLTPQGRLQVGGKARRRW